MSTDQQIQPKEGPAKAAPAGKTRDTRLDLRAAMCGAALAVAIMVPVTATLLHYAKQRIEDRLTDAPPVAIIDFTSAVARYAEVGSTNEDLERMVRSVDATVRKLSNAGFLVLDAKAVLSAPESLYVPQSMILGIEEQGQDPGLMQSMGPDQSDTAPQAEGGGTQGLVKLDGIP